MALNWFWHSRSRRNYIMASALHLSVEALKGDVDGFDAGPRAFFRMALGAGATSAIAVHNHPSGDVTPSVADHAVTRVLAAAGRLIDVPLVDHVVVGDGGRFTSLRRMSPELFL
jgi:DNA repair protein RadC